MLLLMFIVVVELIDISLLMLLKSPNTIFNSLSCYFITFSIGFFFVICFTNIASDIL